MTRRFVGRSLAAFTLIALASCFGDGTGPGATRYAQINIAPVFDRHGLLAVDVNRVLVRFTRANGTKAFETVVDFPANTDTLNLDLAVPVNGLSEVFDLTVIMIDDPAADTVFRSGPTPVNAIVGATPVAINTPPFVYTGVGANAVGVRFVTAPGQVFFGQSVTFTAEAYNSSSIAIPNTPIVWSSSNSAQASVPDESVGQFVAGTTRGTATVKAELLPTTLATPPPSVTAPLVIQPVASALVNTGGTGQIGAVGSVLTQPVSVRVNAADGLGVQGVTVNFAVASGGGSLSSGAVVTNATGDASAVWTLGGTAGAQAVNATVTGVAGTVNFGATALVGPASRLAFTVQPTGGASGSAITPAVQVTAQDAFGNAVPTFTGNVTIAVGNNPGAATLSGTTTVAAVAGVATFSTLSLDAGGAGYTLTASATGLAGAISAAFTMTAAGAAQLAFVVQPAGSTGGAAITPPIQVAVQTSIGVTVPGATNVVTIAINNNPGGGVLSGTASVAAVNGIATFPGLSIDKIGVGYTLTATSPTLTLATSAPFDISPGSPQSLQFGVQPSSATAGVAIAPSFTVTARDAGGNVATSFTGSVSVAFGANPGGATLSGTTTVSAVAGVATFSTVSLDKASTGYTLTATATGVSPATSGAFGVAPAAAATLQFSVQPATTNVGAALPATIVTAVDGFGNVATSFTGSVVLGIGANPGGASLTGTTSVAAVAGVATFGNVTLTAPGVGYTLTASFAGLGGATSTTFDMTLQSVVWTNAAGGNWSTGSNWSGGVAPTATDVATINLAGSYTVTLDVNPTIAGLVVGGISGTQTLTGTSRTLTVNGASFVGPNGALTLTSSSVAGTGNLVNQGSATLINSSTGAAVTVTNQGLLLVGGNTSLTGALNTAVAATLRVQGGLSSTGSLTVANGFTNSGTIELTSTGGFISQFFVTNGTLTNAVGGTISSLAGTSGGGRTLGAQLDNQGALVLTQALTLSKASAGHLNNGTIDLNTANLTVTQSGTAPTFTNTGTITIGSGRTWTVSGGTLNLTAGTVSGAGLLTVTGATMNFTTTTMTTSLDVGTTTFPGGITIPSGQQLTLLNSTITDPVANQGTLLIGGNTVLTRPLTTVAGSMLRIQGGLSSTGSLTVDTGFTNNADIELTSTGGFISQFFVTNGTLTNAVGGTISSLAGTSGGGRTLGAQLDNQGALVLTQALTLSKASAGHLNNSTINLGSANLTVTQSGAGASFTNTGTITIGAGRQWVVSGGTLNLTSGAVSGAGVLTVTGATMNFTTTTMTTSLDVGTTTFPGGITIPSGQQLTLLNSTITDPVANQGTLLIGGNTVLTRPLTTVAGSMLRIQGGLSSTGSLTVDTGFTNNADIELTSTGGFIAQFFVTNGTLTNAVGGTISSLAGTSGGGRTLGAQLDNQGALVLTQALTLSKASAGHLNNSTINLGSANLTVTQSGAGASFTNTGTITIGAGRQWVVSGGTLNLTAGTVSGAGLLTVTGATMNFTTTTMTTSLDVGTTTFPGGITIPSGQQLTLLNSTITDPVTNQGTLLIGGNTVLTRPLATVAGSMLRIQGGLSSTGSLTVDTGFTNNADIELTSTGGFISQFFVTNGTLTNAVGGTISSLAGTSGGGRTLGAQLDNQGALVLTQALTLSKASAGHLNNSTINLGAANLTVTQSGAGASFTNTGTITIGAGRQWVVSGGTLNLTAGTVSGAGLLTVTGATMNFTTATVTTILDVGTTTFPGGITIPGGQQLTLFNSTITDPVTNQGTLLIGGTTVLTRPLTTVSGSMLRIQGGLSSTGSLTVDTGFTNNADIELTSTGGFISQFFVTNGTLTNAVGGTISSLAGTSGGGRTLGAQLDNQGALVLTQALTLSKASAGHLNSSTINLSAANLTVTQSGAGASFTNTGTITIGSGRQWVVSGGTLNLIAGAVSGAGVLTVTGATMNFTTATVTTVLDVGTTTFPGGITIPSGQQLTLLNSTVTDPVNIQGTLIIGGTVALNGAVTTGAGGGSMLRVQGGLSSTGSLTVANGFINSGAIELTSTGGFISQFFATAGTLTNAVGGTISSLAGTSGGGRTLGAQLDNSGTVTVNLSTLVTGAFDQRNTLNVPAGTLTINGLLQLFGGSTTTVTGTLVKNGGCTDLGGIITGATCP